MHHLTLKIQSLNSQGSGVGRHEGKVYFVPWAIPGDVVSVKVEKESKRFSEASVISIITNSPDRIESPCPYFHECGGCQLQQATYEAQLKWKKEIIENALRRIACLSDPHVEAVYPSPNQWHYRNRIQLHQNSLGQIGFYKGQSYEVVEIEKCLIAEEGLNEQLTDIRLGKRGFEGQTMELRADDREVSFAQINTEQNKNLVEMVCQNSRLSAKGGPVSGWRGNDIKNIFDLYCGSGNFTFPLSKNAKHVWAIEKDKRAIQIAKKISEEKKIQNITWIEASAFKGLAQLKRNGVSCDVIVADPPRRGLTDSLQGILDLKPTRLVYVSCDPATFARDTHQLIKSGYALAQCQPLDMFPHTAHVEVVGVFLLELYH